MRTQLLVFLLPAAALAQVTIEGDVVRKTTGEPVAGVGVAAQCVDAPRAATDAAGHFRFTGLPAGSACLLSINGPRWLARSQTVTIKPDDTVIALKVPMTPQSAIAGKIVDEDGWPISEAIVTAAQYQAGEGGVRELQPVLGSYVQADDRGEFRIGKLPPGRYYLRVRTTDSSDYVSVWYPAAADQRDAQPIDLREGQEAAVTIQLRPGGGVEVSGRVLWPQGYEASHGRGVPGYLHVGWEDLGSSTTGPSIPLAPDGSFTLRHLAPRKYLLMASTMLGSAPPAYLAARAIDVGHENIEDITLDMSAPPVHDLKGTLVCEGAVKPEQVRIILQRSPGMAQFPAEIQADGSFVIRGIWAGGYVANVLAGDALVRSILFGGQEVLHRMFDFDGTEAALRVTVAAREPPVQLLGAVTDAGGQPLAGAAVVFVPRGMADDRWNRRTAGTDQIGAFTTALSPGVYRVFVAADPAENERQELPSITVAAGDNPPLKLALPQSQ